MRRSIVITIAVALVLSVSIHLLVERGEKGEFRIEGPLLTSQYAMVQAQLRKQGERVLLRTPEPADLLVLDTKSALWVRDLEVNVTRGEVLPAQSQVIRRMNRLQRLTISGSAFGAAAIREFDGLEVDSLNIVGAEVLDRQWEETIATMNRLSELFLMVTVCQSNEGAVKLLKGKDLHFLRLECKEPIASEVTRTVSEMRRLISMEMVCPSIDPDAAILLGKSSSIEEFDLACDVLTQETGQSIGRMRGLKYLGLTTQFIAPGSLSNLRNLSALKSMKLSVNKLGSVEIDDVIACGELQTLVIYCGECTDVGIARLRSAFKSAEVVVHVVDAIQQQNVNVKE